MKTLVFSMLAMAAMVSCTSESDPIEEIDGNEKVEINLNGGVIATKAAIESTDGLPTEDLPNVHFYRIDGASPDWSTGSITPFSGKILAANGKISLNEKQYYPANGDITSVGGIYLGATTTTPPAITTGAIPVTITGAEDVLSAIPVNLGTRKQAETTPLAFKHLLTQFKFIVKIDNATIKTAITDISIDVKNAKNTTSINFSTGAIGTWTGSSVISGATGLTTPADGTASTASAGIMIEPDLASITLTVKGTGLPSEGLEVTINGSNESKFKQGYAYDITLTFKAKEISGTASIAEWQDGTAAGGDVE